MGRKSKERGNTCLPSDKLTLSSLEWVVDTYTPDLLRLAFVYTKNHADAEDIVQEVLLTYVQAKKTSPMRRLGRLGC